MKETKYICRDCGGKYLQFTGTGQSVQCDKADADQFNSDAEACAALNRAEEFGGYVEANHTAA